MKFRKLFSSLAVLVMVFTIVFPITGKADYSEIPGLGDFSIDDMEISPNDDDKLDETNINFTFTTPQPYAAVELWDALHHDAGPGGDGYLGVAGFGKDVKAENFSVPFDGTYLAYTDDGLEEASLPDGVYSLELWTADANLTNFIIPPQELGPIFIKTTPPVINAKDHSSGYARTFFSGTIQDSFIDWEHDVYVSYGEGYKLNTKLFISCDVTNSIGVKTVTGARGTINDTTWFNCPIEGLTLGPNKVKLYVDDVAGNHTEGEYTVTLEDITPPIVHANVTSPNGNNLIADEVKIYADAKDNLSGVSKMEYRVNNGPWVPYTGPFIMPNTEGTTIDFKATDNGGFYGYDTVTLKKDNYSPTTIPTVFGTEGKPDSRNYRSDVTLSFNAYDDSSGVKSTEYQLFDGEWVNLSGPLAFKKEGEYRLQYRSSDYSGRVEYPSYLYFKIDRTPPVITGVENNKIYKNGVTITYNEGDGFLNGIPVDSGTAVKKPGNYTMVVTDLAGNSTTVPFKIEKTTTPPGPGPTDPTPPPVVNPPVDPTPPPVVNPPVDPNPNPTPPPVVSPPSSGTTPSDTTPPKVSGVENNSFYNKDVTITFSDGKATLNGKEIANKTIVKAEGTYELVVTDDAGNTTTIEFTIDKKAPKVFGVGNSAVYNKNVTVTFNEGTATLNGDWFENNTIINKDGTYALVVTDEAGNKTTVKFTIDKTPPAISGVTNNGYYNKNVTIKISGGTAKLNGKAVSGSTIVVKAEGAYVLVATDTAGNTKTIKFTIDKSAPKIPTVSNVTSKTSVVSGKAEKGTTVYIYNGKKLLGKAVVNTKGEYSVKTGLQKKGVTLSVFAKDLAGNQSKSILVKVK